VKAYSEDLRKRVVVAKERGQSSAVAARRFSLNVRSVERYWKRYRETTEIAPKRHGGYRRSKLAPHDQELVKWINRPKLILISRSVTSSRGWRRS
jgi:transposase